MGFGKGSLNSELILDYLDLEFWRSVSESQLSDAASDGADIEGQTWDNIL